MDTHSQIQECANNLEIEYSQNKRHTKISKFTVQELPNTSFYVRGPGEQALSKEDLGSESKILLIR